MDVKCDVVKTLGAPNFCAGAYKKKKLGPPVHKVSLEPCNRECFFVVYLL